MPELQDTSLKLMRVLDRHQALDVVQLASLTESSVSATTNALQELARYDLVAESDGVYSLNAGVLGELLQKSS
jgi:DNA-binding IclR family transcriptional regulator